jgi:hypothetical protein
VPFFRDFVGIFLAFSEVPGCSSSIVIFGHDQIPFSGPATKSPDIFTHRFQAAMSSLKVFSIIMLHLRKAGGLVGMDAGELLTCLDSDIFLEREGFPLKTLRFQG